MTTPLTAAKSALEKAKRTNEDRINKYVLSEKVLKWVIREAHHAGSQKETEHVTVQDLLDDLIRYKKKPINSNAAKELGRFGPCYVSLTPEEKRKLFRKDKS